MNVGACGLAPSSVRDNGDVILVDGYGGSSSSSSTAIGAFSIALLSFVSLVADVAAAFFAPLVPNDALPFFDATVVFFVLISLNQSIYG
jgi:hypothetical protein